jgi:hypothetical protein
MSGLHNQYPESLSKVYLKLLKVICCLSNIYLFSLIDFFNFSLMDYINIIKDIAYHNPYSPP